MSRGDKGVTSEIERLRADLVEAQHAREVAELRAELAEARQGVERLMAFSAMIVAALEFYGTAGHYPDVVTKDGG